MSDRKLKVVPPAPSDKEIADIVSEPLAEGSASKLPTVPAPPKEKEEAATLDREIEMKKTEDPELVAARKVADDAWASLQAEILTSNFGLKNRSASAEDNIRTAFKAKGGSRTSNLERVLQNWRYCQEKEATLAELEQVTRGLCKLHEEVQSWSMTSPAASEASAKIEDATLAKPSLAASMRAKRLEPPPVPQSAIATLGGDIAGAPTPQEPAPTPTTTTELRAQVRKTGKEAREAGEKAANRTLDDIPISVPTPAQKGFTDTERPSGPPVIKKDGLHPFVYALIGIIIILSIGLALVLKSTRPTETDDDPIKIVADTKVVLSPGRFPMTQSYLNVVNGAWPGASGDTTCWKPSPQKAVPTKPWLDCPTTVTKKASDGGVCYDVTACTVVIPKNP